MYDRLDPDLISANLRTELIGRKLLVFDRTASTNDIAAEYATVSYTHMTLPTNREV